MAAALVLATALAVLALTAGGDDEPRRETTSGRAPAADRSAMRADAGAVVLTRFNGTVAPSYIERTLREGRAAGATLFADNLASPEQLRALTRRLQSAAGGDALIAVDQEGGVARRLTWASPVGQNALGTPAAAQSAARTTAAALRDGGVNLNFAPVADVVAEPGSAIAARAFPGGPDEVSRLTAASVRGYRGSGVAPTLKHFPGFGRATANTDDAPVTIDASATALAGDLVPFRAGIAAGARVVMVSHALYPAYDGAWIASQSRRIVTERLRRDLGFDGVVATDSMEAEAVLSRSSVEEAAVRTIYAGCDLLVLTGRGSQRPVYERLLAEARRSPEFRRRLSEAANRVRMLR